MENLPASSKYGEVISARDSEAVVATDVKGACRLCARGTCCPVRYGESKEESVYMSGGDRFSKMDGKLTSVIAGHRMPERSKSRAETVSRIIISHVALELYKSAIKTLVRQERGRTYDAMSGEGSVIADTLKLFGLCLPCWRVVLRKGNRFWAVLRLLRERM